VGIVSTVRSKWTDKLRVAANRAPLRSVSFLRQPGDREAVLAALRVRAVERALYDAFGKGQLHGAIHASIGQEFSGVANCRNVEGERRIIRMVIFALGLSAIVNILLAAVLRAYYS
jgi:hypothetical protein